MNALTAMTAADADQTMSSVEIAELCEKRHDNVMRDIRAMLAELHGNEAALTFEGSYIGQDQSSRPCFHLPKRETLILVSGYKLPLRARIIDRWQQLEARATVDPIRALNDPATLRGLLSDYSDRVLSLETENRELQPKAKVYDRIAETDGSFNATEAAKTIGIHPSALLEYMRGPGRWLYRRAGTEEFVAYQDKLISGLLVHRVNVIQRPDGTEKTVTRARITPKGLAKLTEQCRDLGGYNRVYAENRIRELREERGMTQGDVANAMPIPTTKATIAKLESRAMALSLDYVRAIALALNCEPSDIIG